MTFVITDIKPLPNLLLFEIWHLFCIMEQSHAISLKIFWT
jgi:hypothetical protein